MKLTAAFSAAALAAIAVAGPAGSQGRQSWVQQAAPFHIIGPVYSVGSEGLAVYLIHTKAGDILLDAGVPEIATQIENNIKTLGFDPKNIKILLNSHAHFDHSGGLAQIKRDTGARLIASEGDKVSLETGTYLGSETVKAMGAPAVKVDQTVKDGGKVTLGEVTLTANLTPGHSRGCTSWTMPIVEAGVTHKAIFFCSATVAANRLAPNPQYPGIVADYQSTFVKARALSKDIDIYFAPHSEFFDMAGKKARLAAGAGSNPFIKKGEFAAAVDKFDADFKVELAKQRAVKP
ncbi:subclass B3 metallo-beta-lactamase BJP-1 [soil metagenome]